MIEFNEDQLSEEIAYIVENNLLLHAVNEQLRDKEVVSILYNSNVENIKLPKILGEDVTVQLQNGKEYKTELLVSK